MQRHKQNAKSHDLGEISPALNGSINVVTDMGFQLLNQGIVAYTQDRLGLSVYYDKCIVAPNGIHTEPLRRGYAYSLVMYQSILSLTMPPPGQNPNTIFLMGKKSSKPPPLRAYKNELEPHPGGLFSIIH